MTSLDKKYDTFYAVGQHHALADVTLRGWPRGRVEAIMSVPVNGETLLDIGCGDGSLLYQFRNRFSELIGVEYSASRLDAARSNLRKCRFRGLQCSAESMPAIASSSVDCIVSADVIEHIPDVYAAMDEMFRVLKPGGFLVVNTPNIAFAKKRLRLLLGRFPSTSQPNEGLGSDVLFDGGHLHYFSFRSLAGLMTRSRFVIERQVGFGPLGRVHDVWRTLTSVGAQVIARKPKS